MKTILLNFSLTIFAIFAGAVPLFFDLPILAYILSCIPPVVSTTYSAIGFYRSKKRKRRIKALCKMYRFYKHIQALTTDIVSINLSRQRARLQLIPLNENVSNSFNEASATLEEFFDAFKIKKEEIKLRSEWENDNTKMQNFLDICKEKLKLSDDEKLLLKAY